MSAGNYYLEQRHVFVERPNFGERAARALPKTASVLKQIAAAFGTPKFSRTFEKLYPQCENISIDYAVLEPRSAKGESKSNIFCLPANFGWNDLGSWTALHEHHAAKRPTEDGNQISGHGIFTLNAEGNYIHAPGKFVAVVGVNNLVVVETKDALLITTREHSQDVGKIVKHLDQKKLHRPGLSRIVLSAVRCRMIPP